jgi:hypothetical protein
MSEYIKSPDGGFLLKDDQINIEKDELNRPVVNLTTAPPQVSDETDGKVLTNDGEKVGWSKGLGVTLEFEPVEMPIEPKFIITDFEKAPTILTSTPIDIDGYFYSGFEFSVFYVGGVQIQKTIYNVITSENPNIRIESPLLELFSSSDNNVYRFYSDKIGKFISGTFGDKFNNFIGLVSEDCNWMYIVGTGTNITYAIDLSNLTSDTTSLVFTKKELPLAKNWSDLGFTIGSSAGAHGYAILVAEDFNGFLLGDNGNFHTVYSKETNFPVGDLIATDYGDGGDNAAKIVTISTKEPIGTFATYPDQIDTWQPTVLPFNGKWSDLQYFNYDGIDVFIAADLNSNKFIYTSDGINWKVGELPFAGCIGFGVIPNGIAAFSPNGYGYCFFNPFIKEYDFTHWYSGYPHEVVNSVPLDYFYI